jgi:hypothetical protein
MRFVSGRLIAQAFVAIAAGVVPAAAQNLATDAWSLESRGEAAQARERLRAAAQQSPNDAAVQRAYAEFLDRHRDPAAREAYSQLAQALERANAPGDQRAAVARRLAVLSLAAGDKEAARRHAAEYSSTGGSALAVPPGATVQEGASIDVPGPIFSFARMAALSPDLPPSEVLPALARNIVTNGYQAVSANEALEQTEFLKLLVRYLSQARELEKLAGPDKILKIDACESTATGDLLRVIGFRMRGGCGSDVVLETVNASRAFLTTDSGFPLAELEQALRTNRPFALDYHPTRIPVLYGVPYWQSAKDKTQGEFIDYFISDPSLARLYLGLSKLDPNTAGELRRAVPAQRLKIFAHVLDFFGGMFEIRDGRAVVPGGARAEKVWGELANVPPEKGAAFFEKLLATDDGWLASYFDALARIQGPVQTYLTEPERLKRFYQAIRGKVTSPGPARPVFRSNTDMLLLTTRLRLESNGRPHVPGSLDVWKNLFVNHPQGKYDAKLSKAANSWKDPDDVLEALFGLSRKVAENEPLKIFMALSDVDRGRAVPLQTATIDRLAREYRTMSAQYPLFAEGSMLADATIVSFLDTAKSLNAIRDQGLRSDAVGSMQALAGLWQIFTRQGSIRTQDADAALAAILAPFGKIQSSREVFDAGQSGVQTLLKAANSPSNVSPQDRIIDLLAGTAPAQASDTHDRLVQDMIRVFESQRLVSLSTLFEMADNLDSVSRGEKLNTQLASRLAARFTEIILPRSAMTGVEKNSQAYGYWSERHIDAQRRLNLRSSIEKAANDAQKLRDLRGQLTPFLRDTLVGFLYMHYAPPGAQVLHTNPLFVRSHDFIGIQGANQTWRPTEVVGTGWPANAGGRLVGSLASLPYALAEAEQNFLIPTREQALIWGDLVPQILQSAVIPRWWNVTPVQLRWVGLHMAYAEMLLGEAALSDSRRKQVMGSLERYSSPGRRRAVEQSLAAGNIKGALENVLPSEMYLLASDLSGGDQESGLARDIRRLAQEAPEQVSARAISRAFGTPKPTLANNYQPELLNLRTFPTLMGYSSRILAESWESNLLYYAALADEIHAQPAELNVLVPEWTQKTVEQIFATHLEDWPALLRSLRVVGDSVRAQARKQVIN